jgi:hypothetical protein
LVVGGGIGIAGRVTAGNIVTTNGVYWANGAAYSSGSGGGGITYTTSNTAPASPSAGNFWYEPATDIKYQYINDGTSSYWVDQSYPTSFGNLTVANTLTVGGTIIGTTTNTNYALAANVSLYESVAATTTNATFYPMLSGITDGNTASFTAAGLTYNPSIGNLSVKGTAYVNNLLLQGDNTNAYIRPRNAGSTLYLGAADSNYLQVTATQSIFTGNVTPLGNLSYNIGTPTAWWNNVYGKAVQAQYADLAEHYTADAEYDPGTVVVFGGVEEITVSDISHDPRVAGVISTDPAYLMNAANPGLPVALTGRVPCQVQGPVTKGDRLVNIRSGVAGRLDPVLHQYGCIIGKSLDEIADDSTQTIEIVVGRF